MAETAAGQQNQENQVSKTEFDALNAKNAELSRTLDQLKGQLLDTDYLSYLEAKKAQGTKPQQPTGQPNANASIANLTLGQLQQVIAAQLNQGFSEWGKPIYERLNAVSAAQEVEAVRGKYGDFDDFRDQTVAVLESTPNTELNIEQAYLIAKANWANDQAAQNNGDRQNGQGNQQQQQQAPQGGEKPGGTVPLPGETAQRFKNPTDAGNAAWNEVRQRHGLTSDTI